MKLFAQWALALVATLAIPLAGCAGMGDRSPIQAVSAGGDRPFGGAPAVEIPPSEAAPPTPGAALQKPRIDIIRWKSALAAHIERFKRYPAKARSSGEQGIAKVAFSIDHQGRLLTSRIVESSGSPTLDQETLAMLVRAQPMPRPPGEVPDNQLSFVVPVRFNIR